MPFNFDTRKTLVSRAIKISSFPPFKYAGILSQLSLFLFTISLFLITLSFLGFVHQSGVIKIPFFLLFCFILFLEINLFVELKIKNPGIVPSFSDAASNPENYNLADFLSLESCKIIEGAIKICKKRKLSEVSSESIFYSSIINSKDIQVLIFRLGIDIKKLQEDLKNYLEKSRPQSGLGSSTESGQPRQEKFYSVKPAESGVASKNQQFNGVNLSLSESFQKTIEESVKITDQRNHKIIGEKEILVALAKHDEFFKKVLIYYDLKEKDIENITLWLDAIENKLNQNRQFWSSKNLSKLGSLGKDWASGFTVTLDKFSVDWSEVAKRNIFNEIIGHKKEIDEVEIILSKSSLRNVLIIGEPGVGRKSIIEALAQRCHLGASLPELNDKKVVELDMVALLSNIQDQEKMEITLDLIFQEAASAGNIILVISELDNFVAQKIQKPGEVDVSVILAKYLAMPDFQFIGITSFDGLHRKLEQNPSFLEYFRKVEVSEISELETIRILQNLALAMEQKYKILIIYPAIREIVNLTARYLPSVPFPQKAIDVLDESAVYVKSLKEKVVLPHHIAKIISDKTQIPVGKMEFKEKSVLLNLENLIHQKIINQHEAVSEISIAMRRARSGISSKKRPMGVFLFMGPTGVGKTETAKALAEIYFGGEERMIRLDMSEFQAIIDIPRLIGAINPIEQQGLLTTPVREKPFSLVLLDEIEKAHPDILNLFLQVFDDGHITDGQGRKVIFTNTIIICTSNAGAATIFQAVESEQKIEKNKLLDSLFNKGIFRPEFINRFDATVIFQPLTKENLMDITQLMLSSLVNNLKEKEIDFIITEPLKEKIVELSYKPEFGARETKRIIQDKVENEIAQALLSDKITKGDKIEINPENFEIVKISS